MKTNSWDLYVLLLIIPVHEFGHQSLYFFEFKLSHLGNEEIC